MARLIVLGWLSMFMLRPEKWKLLSVYFSSMLFQKSILQMQ